ncbi:hypothetical protein PAECIP111893_02385 [Paenibacillus plantiphilus]|uniref:Uncharacterized protein n=1 Tax=Paenibacillus plantiphilus TaxID=2905650 RepID=A0ABM9C834_9BACL|nr:hypothetical protein [Paenibacillus plantiphilus]CAH1205646.1 hypothetical protein PAECIP111893_02385 [Paenibacillus plantiphilus]
MSKYGVDYRTKTGKGIVRADGFSVGSVTAPKAVVSTTVTFDPPSLATGAFAVSSGITVTGSALGDNVELYPPYDTDGVIYQGSVSAANTIKISLINTNGSTKDLASGAWGVVVKRRV